MPERWSIDATPDPAAVAAVRTELRAVLARYGVEAVGDAELLAWELVTNAIFHAGTAVEVVATVAGGRARVSVHDASSAPLERRPPDPRRVGGHGLELVDGLSDRWGVTPARGGKAVWFEVACHDPAVRPAV